MNADLKKSLSMLELSDLARIIETHGNDLKLVNMPFNERMEFLLTLLVQERENRLVDRLIRNAGFKYPMASLESLDFESRQIKKEVLVNLVGTAFVANATNIFITGPTGAGKTYLSCALGIEACRQRFRTLYIRMPDLLRHFESNRDNRMLLARYRKQLCNYQLLIIDEWLNYKVSENDAKILYELFDGRCEKNSTIFVGQFPPDEWHGRLGGGTQADSIMDRIIYNTFEIPAGETNLRKIYESRKLKKLMTAIGE